MDSDSRNKYLKLIFSKVGEHHTFIS